MNIGVTSPHISYEFKATVNSRRQRLIERHKQSGTAEVSHPCTRLHDSTPMETLIGGTERPVGGELELYLPRQQKPGVVSPSLALGVETRIKNDPRAPTVMCRFTVRLLGTDVFRAVA